MAVSDAGPHRIFISYRRADASWPARWLTDQLAGHFGAGVVFQDVESIWPGDDFAAEIEAAVGACSVLLVLIGPRWLAAGGDEGRRLDDPGDWVRLELEAALTRGVRIIPVLVDGATMPAADELPPPLRELTRRQAAALDPATLDTRRLISVLETVLQDKTPGPADTPKPEPVRPTAPVPRRRTYDTATFRISLLGPAGVGKTSLVTALLAEFQRLLAGISATIHAADRETEYKIVQKNQEIDDDLQAGEFTPAGLSATAVPFTFKLKLDPGVPESEIRIELLDFPAAWLNEGPEWEACRSFVTHSTILLIPVDATLLMEATEARHMMAMTRLLDIVVVEQVARDWAIERNRRPAEPALLVFCPVKCESYFSDNGGPQNKSPELSRRFREAYAHVLRAVRDEAPTVEVQYVPVDTMGCVEIIDAHWPVDTVTNEVTSFSATYIVRPSRRISRSGAEDLIRAICRHLMTGRSLLGDENRGIPTDEGFFRDIALWRRNERSVRRSAARTDTAEAQRAVRRIAALDDALTQIARSRFGPRVETP